MTTKTPYELIRLALLHTLHNLDDHFMFFLFGEDWTEVQTVEVRRQYRQILDEAKELGGFRIGNPEHRPKNERTKIEAIRSLRKRYGLGLYEAKVLFESYTMHVYGRESGGITDQDLAMIGLWITHVQGIMGRTEGQYLNRLLRILVPQGTGARLLMIDWDGIYDATLEHIHGEFKVNG